MKRLLLFLLLAGTGTVALLLAGGGFEGPLRSRPQPIVEERTEPLEDGPKIEMGAGSPDIDAIEGITQPAPPRRIVWEDRLSDERIEIPTFVPWRFQARDARPLQTPGEERQGVLSRDVHMQMFRKPATRAEAVALVRNEPGAYDALLHQDFTAKEARVYGRLGEALSQKHSTPKEGSSGLGDTVLRLTRDVVLVDRSQGIEIRGNDMRIWPEQDRAEGDGPFTLTHTAMVLSGKGLVMERDEARGWSRVSVKEDPVLRIVSEGRGKDGKPIFNFGPGGFRPATIASSGRAILVRQEGRAETVITVTFPDDVLAVQQGGRTMSAGRAELVAVKPGPAKRARASGWRLQRFHAGKKVKLDYLGSTRDGTEFLTSISADRLSHDVPEDGTPATVLEGHVTILLRGEIALLGPGGRLHLTCRDRAWIGPLPAGAPDGGLERATLQQIGLRGNARIEREIPGPAGENDALAADAIDLVVQPRREPEQSGMPRPETRMLSVHFAALGNVDVSGTRIRGATHRLIGDDLHTEHPHITAEGTGTWFDFPDLAPDQRLLGPDAATPSATEGAAARAPAEAEKKPEGRWVLQRLLARGAVDITTSVGGPALGIPAHLHGDEVSYDRLSRRARLVGAPAHIAWSASRTQTNTVETRELTLDRSGGRITATGGVLGELYVAGKGGTTRLRPPEARSRRDLRGATLSVRTDERIDIRMLRGDTESWKPAPGKEQIIRIAGPVSTELRAADNSIDRMRSESLEVALVFAPLTEKTPTETTAPTARAGGGRAGAEQREPGRPTDAVLERLDVQAKAVRVDMQSGDVSFLEATGGVDLKSRGGHVRGERLTYEAPTERIDVVGTAKQHAVAFLGSSSQRSEVNAERLQLKLVDGQPARLEAHAPRGGTSDVHLYRSVRSKPGQLEWFAVTYEGTAVITHDLLSAGRVRVIRRLRQPGQSAWGEAAILRSPTLRVVGRQLLATDEGAREILQIVAEGLRQASKGDVHFLSGSGAKRLQIWGQRFDFDVVKRKAHLTGLPGRDVRMQRGDGLDAKYIRVTIDMKTNLPTAEGSRILWRPR